MSNFVFDLNTLSRSRSQNILPLPPYETRVIVHTPSMSSTSFQHDGVKTKARFFPDDLSRYQTDMFDNGIYIFETVRKKEYIELCCTVPGHTFLRHWNLSHTFFIFPSQLDDLASAIHSLRSPFICR